MSILGLMILFYEFGTTMYSIYGERENVYILNSVFYSTEEMIEMDDFTLGKFNNSANFAFGFTGEEIQQIDILNNPYVEFIGLEMT